MTKRFIIRLGRLLAHLRGVIPRWETRDSESQGINYAYTFATIEEPDRAIKEEIRKGNIVVTVDY
jgi:uncharacterized protein YaiI (UPF0178 family)